LTDLINAAGKIRRGRLGGRDSTANLDHAGLAGSGPLHAVTFVENHDTESRREPVPRHIQPEDKPPAYAYILTSEGLPCVFYKDYSTDPRCLSDRISRVANDSRGNGLPAR
jgi:alpha-amylase